MMPTVLNFRRLSVSPQIPIMIFTRSRRLYQSSSISSRLLAAKIDHATESFLPTSVSLSRQKQNTVLNMTHPHRQNYSSSSADPYRTSSSMSFSSPSSSPSSSFGDIFGSLRMKAAQAITSSLPDDEKSALLERMGDGHDDGRKVESGIIENGNGNEIVDDDHYKHTIDEAVAAAKAKEAERYEEKWEAQKEKILAEAEEAARRRIESDLEIQRRQVAFEAWKRDVERDLQQQHQIDGVSSTTGAPSREEALGEHPILGACIADLGHKRIHTASARALSAIPVWKKQRIYRHDRAKAMAKGK